MDPEKCRLFVGNLPHGTNEKRLVRFIRDVGLEKSLTRVAHTAGKRFCFMSWKTYEDTVRAKRVLETNQLDGNRITVEYPKDSSNDDRPRGGGGGGRGAAVDPRQGSDWPGGGGGGSTDLESIRNSLAQQLDMQRQQLLAKQKEVLQHAREEVLGPRGRWTPHAPACSDHGRVSLHARHCVRRSPGCIWRLCSVQIDSFTLEGRKEPQLLILLVVISQPGVTIALLAGQVAFAVSGGPYLISIPLSIP